MNRLIDGCIRIGDPARALGLKWVQVAGEQGMGHEWALGAALAAWYR